MIQNFSKEIKEVSYDNSKLKIAIVKSNYHNDLTQRLEQACRGYLIDSGVKEENIATFNVSGAWEIPLIAKKIAVSKKYDGIVTFGVIVKGETYHFEAIANEVSRSLMDLALEFNIPITFEVLAVYDIKDAEKRSTGEYNKGLEAAKTVLETVWELSKI